MTMFGRSVAPAMKRLAGEMRFAAAYALWTVTFPTNAASYFDPASECFALIMVTWDQELEAYFRRRPNRRDYV